MLSLSLLLLGAGSAVTAALGTRRAASAAFIGSLVLGCGAGFGAAFGWAPAFELPWALPSARLAASVDGLSALFLVAILLVCGLSGIYGEAYIQGNPHLSRSRSIRPLFLLLTGAMVAVVCARNAILFLFAWEVMALASFFLIIVEDERAETRRAGLLYFVCTHTATLALFLLFALLGRKTGTLDFDAMRAALPSEGALASAALALGFVGFGMKAGLAPLHIWLQEAHPAAPTHVSAVLSGVVIKIGIYGFLRLIWLLKTVPEAWAYALLAAGAVSGIGGVLFALASHDLKRLLAYHSVENIGIIALGLGLGCLGLAHGHAELALLGFSGAALHSLNHALFKSLLFLGSGAFAQQLGTRDIEAGGGLLKVMPWTSALSLIAAAAISGVPPFNGFVSEWLVYSASAAASGAAERSLAAVSFASLALIGGLALACFTKAYGALCLGSARTEAAKAARDPGPAMIGPMAALAAACVLIGVFPEPAAGLAAGAAAVVCGDLAPAGAVALSSALGGARLIGALGLCVFAAAGLLLLWRSRLAAAPGSGPTWGCGYTAPTPRMQYTASSFAQPLTSFFAPVLGGEAHVRRPAGYWPDGASFESHTPDRVLDGALRPAAGFSVDALAWLKSRLTSRLQYYMLLAALCLLILLFWKL